MKTIKLPKGNGQHRLIYVPSHAEKRELKPILSGLNAREAPDYLHGFVPGRSPVTCAAQHVGYQYTLTMDLSEFFDSVTEEHLRGKVSKETLAKVLVDGAPRQGLPTSPAIANLAASDMDKAILKLRKKCDFVYTRYADDLTFSSDDREAISLLERSVPEIVRRCGFRLNESKTHLYDAKAGRRMVVGIAVDDDLHVSRKFKRRLRAAEHQKTKSVGGMREWQKLKPPRPKDNDLPKLLEAWNLNLPLAKLPKRQPDEVLGSTIITGDSCMLLGCSVFTTGWKSCLSWPCQSHPKGGSNKRASIWWLFNSGTYLAYEPMGEITVHGVTRPRMRSRARGATVWKRTPGVDPPTGGTDPKVFVSS